MEYTNQEDMREKLHAEDKQSVCQFCAKIYDQIDEPKEVKESGEFICPLCWDEIEDKNK